MLQSLREQSGKWFIKVLFVAIIASFMVWGIGDIIRSYINFRPVAKVGERSISQEEFLSALQQAVSRFQHLTKGKLSTEQLRELSVEKQVIEQLISQATLEETIKQLNLYASDEMVRRFIHSMEEFKHNGSFNKNFFSEALKNNNLTESQFIQQVRKSLLKEQLLMPLTMGIQLPNDYKEIIYKSLTEEKVFTVVTVPYNKMKVTQTPTEEELTTSFNQNKEQYAVPEYRNITLVMLDTKVLLNSIPVSEEESKQEYEKRQQDFIIKEKRHIKQIIYPSKELAQDALEKLKSGRPISAVVRDVKGGEYKDLGRVEKEQIDNNITETIFSLELGTFSEIIEEGFTYSIYQVSKIDPASTRSFDEVRSKIEEEIRIQKSSDFIQDIKNKIEDALAAGTKLSDIAKEYHLQIESINAMDQKGLNENGKVVLDTLTPDVRQSIIDQAFQLAQGNESPIVDVNNNLGFVLKVEKIISAYIPEFKEVKEKVQKEWISQKQQEAAAKLSNSLSSESKSLNDLTQLANKNNLTLSSNYSLSRIDIGSKKEKDKKQKGPSLQELLSADLLEKIFSLPINQATYGLGRDGYVIVMLQKINPVSSDKSKADEFNKKLDGMLSNDLSKLAFESFKQKLDISINQELINQIKN